MLLLHYFRSCKQIQSRQDGLVLHCSLSLHRLLEVKPKDEDHPNKYSSEYLSLRNREEKYLIMEP